MDPVLHYSAKSLLLLILGGSVLHQILNFKAFKDTVQQYDLVPRHGALLVALAVPILSGLVFCGLLRSMMGYGSPFLPALAACFLFVTFGLAMAVNLVRGNSDMDCGCFWGSVLETSAQKLSPLLLIRNGILALLALSVMMEPGARAVTLVDAVNILFFAASGIALYFLIERLIQLKLLMDTRL